MNQSPPSATPPREDAVAPDRRISTKMAVAGLAALAIAAAGATLAAAASPDDRDPEPESESPPVSEGSVGVDSGQDPPVDQFSGIVGVDVDEPTVDDWYCPPCGMG